MPGAVFTAAPIITTNKLVSKGTKEAKKALSPEVSPLKPLPTRADTAPARKNIRKRKGRRQTILTGTRGDELGGSGTSTPRAGSEKLG
jgi:hypothetical protein